MEKKKQEMIMTQGWRHSLIHTLSFLESEESFKYLARKAEVLLEKEQHNKGNMSYISIYSDPDYEVPDPGG